MENKYKDLSKDALIKKIDILEKKLSKTLEDRKNQMNIEFPWAGNLGQWSWRIQDNTVVHNDKKIQQLGYEKEEVGDIGFEFFTDKLHPDDYQRVMDNMRAHLYGKSDAYEVEYRIMHKEGHYLWYYDRGVITERDDDGKPLCLQGIVFDISKSKQIEEKLIFLAERDDLTKVYNRRAMFKHIAGLIKEHEEQGHSFSMLMLDIDGFKEINDHYGHLIGDDALISLAKCINQHKRDDDLICRYGGDEFFLLMPKTTIHEAKGLAFGLRKAINDMYIPDIGSLSVSIGISEHHLDQSIDRFVNYVDDLVYQAKDKGKNCIEL